LKKKKTLIPWSRILLEKLILRFWTGFIIYLNNFFVIFPVLFCTGKGGLMVFENRVLRRIFGRNKEGVAGG
jgi:hypothetical protein